MKRDATIKRYQKSQFSKSKRNQTGNEHNPRKLEAAEIPIQERA